MDKSASFSQSLPQDLYIFNNPQNIGNEELTYDEQRQREYLERIVERNFYEAGKALQELRDRRLYRSTHRTFEEYAFERFGYRRSYSYQIIDAAIVVDNLKGCPRKADIFPNSEKVHEMVEVFPTAETQVRPLVKLEPEEQVLCWQQAVKEAGGKVPSGRIVKNVVDDIRRRIKVPNPYRLGEVCVFIPKGNPELKGKSGCWGIVASVGDFSCTIETWDGEYTVKLENLKSLELTDDDCKFMQNLCLRLQKLYKIPNLDFTITSFLASVGKQCNPYITEVQKKVIETIELHYNVPNITLVA